MDHDSQTKEELLKLKWAIVRELIVMRRAIEKDADFLEGEWDAHGNILYHDEEGNETEMHHTFLAGQLRLQLKSLLECVTIIDQKLKVQGAAQNDDEKPEEWDPRAYLEKSKGRKKKS